MILTFFREREQEAMHELLVGLVHPVHLLLFTSPDTAEYGAFISDLLNELVACNELLSLEMRDRVADSALAARFGITNAPAIVVLAGEQRTDTGIRFCGLPGGYLFPALLEVVLIVGGASTNLLQPATRAFLQSLSEPLRVHVFVTANIYACLPAVMLAYRLALESAPVTATGVEVLAFPELAHRYPIKKLPTLLIGERVQITGAVSEPQLLEILQKALDPSLGAARIFYRGLPFDTGSLA